MFYGMIANLEGTHLKESVESTPPANRHSHHPTTHRGALLDGERLTVPASSSRLSELELRSWEREEGGRGELQCKSRGGWRVEGGENKTKTHLKVTLVPSVWAAGPGHDSAGLKNVLCHIYLWLLMWLGLISESRSDQTHVKHHDWWWGQAEGLQKALTHIHTPPTRPRLMAGLVLSSTYINIKLVWFRRPTIKPYHHGVLPSEHSPWSLIIPITNFQKSCWSQPIRRYLMFNVL